MRYLYLISKVCLNNIVYLRMAINGKIERLCRLHRSVASVDGFSKLVVLLLFIEILLFIGASANCGVRGGVC